MNDLITHYDLFAGIGGFSLALDNVFGKGNTKHIFVERDEFCQLVLKKHWSEAKYYSDIYDFVADAKHKRLEGCEQNKTTGYPGQCNGEHGDKAQIILTGGFPCQPFSSAGRRKGTDDDRYLWPAMLESIRLIRPNWIIAENVAGLVTWNEGMVLEQVCTDLESEGYEVQAFIIPACAVNAPHRRDRVWIVAHSVNDRSRPKERRVSKAPSRISQEYRPQYSPAREFKRTDRDWEFKAPNWTQDWIKIATRLCGIFNGLSAELDETKLKNYADLSKKIRSQDLPYLWHNFQSEEVQWKIGRFDPLQQKNYLFTILWQLTAESRGQNNLSFESEEVQEAYLRNVWLERKIGCTPQRWEYQEQYAREHSNALSQLSHEIALATAEICKWYNQDRNPRLKALGNAIVPQVAEEIFKGIRQIALRENESK